MNRKDFEVGQGVMVCTPSHRGSVYSPGEIVKIGRTLLDITYGPSSDRLSTQRFYMETGKAQGESYGYGVPYFLTMEQYDVAKRRQDAKAALDEAKVRTYEADLPLERLEALAAALTPNPWRYVAIVRNDQGGTCVNEFKQAGFTSYPDEMRAWLDNYGYDSDDETWLLVWKDGDNIGEIVDIVSVRQFRLGEQPRR